MKRLLKIQEKYCSCTNYTLIFKDHKSNYDKIVVTTSQRRSIIPHNLDGQLDAENTPERLLIIFLAVCQVRNHVDNHISFQNDCQNLTFGGSISIRKPSNTKLL